ncbi:MAG: hypothetical protein PHU71_07035 [Candidatus Gracilibacteria bacterium]|nr:hypothetical protein [Candidatus Gracilibacteria bacterium]
MIDPKVKDMINAMTYGEMLRLWRFSPIGDPMFEGELGSYFQDVMVEKKRLLSNNEQVSISKMIGWEQGY